MSEYHEMVKEAAEARIGADRMALGLSCIPDPLRGDLAEIKRLRERLSGSDQLAEARHQNMITMQAEIERLNGLVRLLDNEDAAPLITEAAAFLDRLAADLEKNCNETAAADCRAMARKLEG